MRFVVPNPASRGDKIEWTPSEIRGVIHGSLPNKSNSRRLVPIRGRMRSIKAQNALYFLAQFNAAARASFQHQGTDNINFVPAKKTFLFLDATVYYPDMQRDLDIELLCDALQKSGVIWNDRYIREKHSLALIDKENPRVEFVLRKFLPEKAKLDA